MRYEIDGIEPDVTEDGTFVAPDAALIGRVRMAARSSVWFNAVLRGDNEYLTLGEGTNIQDGCVCHTDMGFPLTLGANVTVGHKVILHGCSIANNVLVGMGSTIMNGVTIEENVIIGANTLIPEGKTIPANSLVIGAPGKVVRELTDAERNGIHASAEVYVRNAARFRDGLSAA